MMKPVWQFDEMKHTGVDFSNPEEVEQYDRKQGSDAAQERQLLQSLGVSKGHVTIEFGCGTGVLSIEATKLCKRVYSVDVSAAMLQFLQHKANQLEIENIECHNKGFLTYEHSGSPADFIITENALHHLPDFWKMRAFHRMYQMMRPGGIFYLRDVIFSFEPTEVDKYIESWIDAVSNPAGWARNDFETHVREEYSTYSWLLEEMIAKAGFEIQHAKYHDLKTYAEYVCIKR